MTTVDVSSEVNDVALRVEKMLGARFLEEMIGKAYWNMMTGGCQTEFRLVPFYVLGQGSEGKIRKVALIGENRLVRGSAAMANAALGSAGAANAVLSYTGNREGDYKAAAQTLLEEGRRVWGIRDLAKVLGENNLPETQWDFSIASYTVKDAGSHSGNEGGTIRLTGIQFRDDGKIVAFCNPFENRQYTHPQYDKDSEPSELGAKFFGAALERFRDCSDLRGNDFTQSLTRMIETYWELGNRFNIGSLPSRRKAS